MTPVSEHKSTEKKVYSSPLTQPVDSVKGIGEKRGAALIEAGIETIEDLLLHIPRLYLDRRELKPLGAVEVDTTATAVGTVKRTYTRSGRPGRFELILGDDSGMLKCTWFGNKWMHGLRRKFNPGDMLIVSGKVSFYNGKQMVTPEYDILTEAGEDTLHTGRVIPVYRSSAGLREVGLDSRGFRRIIKPLLDRLRNHLEETLPDKILNTLDLPARSDAIYAAHFPETPEEAERARSRLAFDELFYMELLLALRKHAAIYGEKGIAFTPISPLARRFVEQLPFNLTPSQKQVIREIHSDMCRPVTMNRLLQGDVGAGKTVVAVIAMLLAVESGFQAALMAPTEILAEQHAHVLREMLAPLGVAVTYLIGGLSDKERRLRLTDVAGGTANIIVGTHALIQEDVIFHNLGFAVIDEQHRFGVAQRSVLRDKGERPDILVMTATPIPRTLALTIYGDLDVSVLEGLPPGRQPITTRWLPESQAEQVYDAIREEIGKGRQAFIVCPLVEESEKMDLKSAVELSAKLQAEVFPEMSIGLLHGRMKSKEKEAVMQAFKDGKYNILVSTTVIEVGIDIPNASIMAIEQAERFGLAQLHQLRGRIGRGEHASSCILINGSDPDKPVPDDTLRRLQVMTETQDGFLIADEDLKIRGPGEFMGTRQHGLPGLKIADLLRDAEWLRKSRKAAFDLVAGDPKLSKPDHARIRTTLAYQYADVAVWLEVA